jgi:protein tyrosine/serine phosphatase
VTAPTTTRPVRRRLRIALVLLGVAFGLGLWWWLEDGRHLVYPKNWGVVEEGRIYRSGRIHRRLIENVLREHGIEVVVDLAGTDGWDPNFQPERDAAKKLGIEHHTFSSLDGHGIGSLDEYEAAFAILLEARRDKRPILVHCGGGSERTGATFAWYRMLLHGWDGAQAYDEYLSYRSSPPKTDALRTFVNEHFPEIVKRMQARGLIERVPDRLPVFGPAGDQQP